jgi:predicted dehydrogenase
VGRGAGVDGVSGELRLGLVGCGRLAERGYVPAAAAARDVRLVAVADPVAERRAGAAPGVPGFEGAATLLQATAADALVVATPVESHLADARLAAAAGIPSLVEKPPARDAEEARELARLDPAPRFGFNRRFDPAVEALAGRLPREGPLELRLELRYRRRTWRAYEERADALLDLGPHLVDLARVLSGAEPERVRAEAGPDAATVELDLGARGHALLRCSCASLWSELVEARAAGALVGRSRRGGLVRGLVGRARGARPGAGLVPTLVRQLEAFAAAVRGRPAPELATAADAVAVMAVLDAARASAAAAGAWKVPAYSAPASARSPATYHSSSGSKTS